MSDKKLTSLSLFTGAGGLDIGLEAAGFLTSLCVEVDPICRTTLSNNRPLWNKADPSDIHQIILDDLMVQACLKEPGDLDLLAGGPPCQPFSKSGYWVNGGAKRLDDPRAGTLKAYLDVIEHTLPKVFLLENVKGLAFRGKDEGLQLLKAQLNLINKRHNCQYQITSFHLNCADFGVPQLRERIFILGSRNGALFSPPEPTHTCAEIDPRYQQQRYLNTWDAIGDLEDKEWDDELLTSGKWSDLLPTIPEGHNYQWHTPGNGGAPLFGHRTRFWSFLLKLAKNKPSWTLQAAPGPATGPFHWNNRRLSVQEMARLQTFPDNYTFAGKYKSAQRQIGNAVPPAIGYLLGAEIRKQLFGENVRYQQCFIPSIRQDCPEPERRKRLPKKYWHLRGQHAAHPGSGLGPAAHKPVQKKIQMG